MHLSHRYQPVADPRAGSVATIWTVRDRVIGSVDVLKLAPAGSQAATRLLREGQRLAELEHPRLPPCHELFDAVPGLQGEPVCGFSMPWLDGQALDQACAGRSLDDRVELFGQLLDAVGYLHDREVLHLDLKPANVWVTANGPVLLDLGTAQGAHDGALHVGGTIGYAAPEVLEQSSPTVLADVYSLGVVLYEMLAGRRPFPATAPHELRRDVLGGQAVPLRAVAPNVPPALAGVVHAMLAREPSARPSGVAAIRARLRDIGYSAPDPHPGAPPLVGRAAELADLRDMLEADDSPVAVTGVRGAGRDRLARAALRQFLNEGAARRVDLSRAISPLAALYALVHVTDGDVPDAGPSLESAIRRRLSRANTFRGRVYVGRAEDLDTAERAQLIRLQPALARAGIALVWAARRAPPEARPFAVAPLDVPDLERIGRFAGAPPGPGLRQAVASCDGNPGLLLGSLRARYQELDAETARAADALRTLPVGVPGPVWRGLPIRWQEAVRVLLVRGLGYLRADGRLVLDGARREPVDPALGPFVQDLPASLPAHWRALTLCRLGRADEARRLGAELVAADEPTSERAELLEHLARAGDGPAAAELCRILCANCEYDAALTALELAPDVPHALRHRLVVLAAAGRHDEADALLREQPPTDAATWVVVAQMAAARMDLDRAVGALAEAERADPREPGLLGAHLALAAARADAGGDVEGLAGLLDRAMAAAETNALDHAALHRLGRALHRSGDVDRACRFLALAVRAADAAGDERGGTLARLGHADALTSAGRGTEARRAYVEALAGARALRFDPARIRILHGLAELELRASSFGPARRWIREYEELALQLDEPEVDARGRNLRAWLAAAEGRYQEIPELLRPVLEHAHREVRLTARSTLAYALVRTGRPDDAVAVLDAEEPSRPFARRNFLTVRGLARLALARRDLATARRLLPDDPEPHDVAFVGRTLLAAAGEDLDATSFEQRRHDLDRAARMLRGPEASAAATLRDRLLPAPGAGLDGIVELLEAVRDPERFPATLARVVSEALGAHRVLILARIPGLGRQLGVVELTQQEIAGVSDEVMRRITRADDVWLEADAFADPAIREVSATVRTFEIRSVLAVAIPDGQDAMGALYVDDLHRSNRFTERDVALLKRLAAAAADLVRTIGPGNAPASTLPEPEDLLGLLLTEPRQVAEVRHTLEMLAAVRDEHANLLLTGATGTGKTWLAERIAREVLGLRGVITHNLRQTEPDKLVGALAGTRRGDFTGAVEQRGLVRTALEERKALFLDEIQALDDSAQTALLPLLELPRRRLGGLSGATGSVESPLIVILGTNVRISNGRWREHFRQDLWFRMSQLHIHLPRLAERGPEVIYRHLADLLRDEGVASPPEEVLEAPALQRIVAWSWPGNLRELVSAAKEIAFRFRRDGHPLTRAALDDLRVFRQAEILADPIDMPRPAELRDPAIAEIWSLLSRASWNQSEVARLVGCSTSKINRMLKRAGLLDEVRLRRARDITL